MQVSRLDAKQADWVRRWDAFVFAHPQATFFHRAGWQQIMAEVFRHPTHFLYAHRGEVIEGVLPLAHVKSRLFGNALTSLPFAVYGGVVAHSEEAAQALETEAMRLAQSLDVDHLEMRYLQSPRHPEWPKQDLYVTFRKEILQTEEENMLAIPRKQRAMVRKGIKNGLTAQVDTTVDRFFSLYADNVHRHGTPALSKRYFQRLMDVFGPDCEILTVSRHDCAGRSGDQHRRHRQHHQRR